MRTESNEALQSLEAEWKSLLEQEEHRLVETQKEKELRQQREEEERQKRERERKERKESQEGQCTRGLQRCTCCISVACVISVAQLPLWLEVIVLLNFLVRFHVISSPIPSPHSPTEMSVEEWIEWMEEKKKKGMTPEQQAEYERRKKIWIEREKERAEKRKREEQEKIERTKELMAQEEK